MFDKDHDISVLNGLIATTLDSVDGYRSAAEDADSGQYQAMFRARADERQTVARKLQDAVRSHGGNPEDDGTVAASAHRAFMGLKDAITGKDDQAIVNEVERGEDHIKAKYESALKDDKLAAETRALITGCYESVRAGHDEMSALKHALKAG